MGFGPTTAKLSKTNDDLNSFTSPEVTAFRNQLDAIFNMIIRGDWEAISDLADILAPKDKQIDIHIPLFDNRKRIQLIN